MKSSFAEIVDALGSSVKVVNRNSDLLDSTIDTLLTDSRSLRRPHTSVFFAIRTPGGNDGHRFIRDLYDRGVRFFVANEVPENMADADDASFIITENTVGTLQKIAGRSLSVKADIVAITGSRGKTTLKEWIFQLLEPMCEIARSPRSFNSQTGVPLSMWEIEPSTKLAIIEAGISKKGNESSRRLH